MSDNIDTLDANEVPQSIAFKDIGGVKFARTITTDPTGADISPATEATLAALNVIAAAVKTAVEAINGKTTAVNTGAIAGTVALDAPTLAALEAINIGNLPADPPTQTTLATIAGAVGVHDDVASTGRPGMVMLVRRRDSDAEPTVDDGDLTYLNIDEEGRLKISSKPASYPDITGSITAVQATIGTPVAGGTVSGDVSRASNVMAFCSGTFSTVNCTFEGSLEPTGDTNWFGVQAVRSNANTIETATGNLSAQPVYAWELSVNALARLRVRCTARTSGTQNWRFKLGTYATEPIPAAQVSAAQPVTQSGAWSMTGAGTPAAPATPYILNSTASENAALILTGTSGLQAFYATNTGATPAFVKLYNKATAPISTDIPAMILPVPAAVSGVPGTCTLPIGFSGFRFALGLGIRITGAVADNDTTAVAAGQVKVMLSRTV